MSILVIGATGTLGRQVTRRALDEGHQVRCMVRNFKRAAFLKEWGAELVYGNLCDPESLPEALAGVTAVIDVATARASNPLSMKQVDWDGKVNLIQAVEAAGIDRYMFFSILDAEKHPKVPLMQIKHCTELYLAETKLKYTVLKTCGFMQGLIGQYAIPILESQSVWVMGESAPTAYMDTIDIAKFAISALDNEATYRTTLPVVGARAWGAYEIIQLCERLSGKDAKVTKVPISVVRITERIARFFQWSWNIADRLAFTEVVASGQPLNADMTHTYEVLGLKAEDTSTLESYMQEYFSRILKKLKEVEYAQEKAKKKKVKKKMSWF